MSTLEEVLTAIADTIREKADYPAQMMLDEMPEKIGWVYDAGEQKGQKAGYDTGFQKGRDEGYADGYEKGETDGYNAGKQAEYDAIWDGIQNKGARNNYQYAFQNAWDKASFRPKYDIKPTGTTVVQYTFYYFNSNISESEIEEKAVDLVEVAEQQGIVFDFSGVKNFTYTFSCGGIKRLGVLDFRAATVLNATFFQREPYALSRIEKIISAETTPWSGTGIFSYCKNLTHCIFEGVIGKSGLKISPATKLDKESITSIINCLSTTTSGLSVTLSKKAVDKAFETSEGANDGSTSAEWEALEATKTNWTISLA